MKTQYSYYPERCNYVVRKMFTPSSFYCEEFDDELFLINKKVLLKEFNKRANKSWVDRFSIK